MPSYHLFYKTHEDAPYRLYNQFSPSLTRRCAGLTWSGEGSIMSEYSWLLEEGLAQPHLVRIVEHPITAADRAVMEHREKGQ